MYCLLSLPLALALGFGVDSVALYHALLLPVLAFVFVVCFCATMVPLLYVAFAVCGFVDDRPRQVQNLTAERLNWMSAFLMLS